MFPGRQDLNFWCCFMCIQSINWPPQFSEVIRGKQQKPITVRRTLNQTDMSLKRYGHEKLTGGFWGDLKCEVFFSFFVYLSWCNLHFFQTVSAFNLSSNTGNLTDTVSFNNSRAVNLKKTNNTNLYFRKAFKVVWSTKLHSIPAMNGIKSPFFQTGFYADFFLGCCVTIDYNLMSYCHISQSRLGVNLTSIYWHMSELVTLTSCYTASEHPFSAWLVLWLLRGDFRDFMGSVSLSCVLGSRKLRANQVRPGRVRVTLNP